MYYLGMMVVMKTESSYLLASFFTRIVSLC